MAAGAVALYHAHWTLDLYFPPSSATEQYLYSFGKVGVHVFFVISGFIMYLTIANRGDRYNTGEFLKRRFVRIYPVYWIIAMMFLALHYLTGRNTLSLVEILGSLLLLPADSAKIIGPGWTLSYELYFYILLAVAMLAGLRRGVLVLSGLLFTLAAIGAIVRPADLTLSVLTNPLLLEFLAGVWIGWLTIGAPRRSLPAGRASGWTLIALSVLLYAAGIAYGFDRVPSVAIWGVPSALLVLGAIVVERSGRGVPAWAKPFVRLGDSSYSLYLIHLLVIDLIILTFRAMTPAPPPTVPSVLFLTAVAVAVAHQFYLRIESPLTRALNKRISV